MRGSEVVTSLSAVASAQLGLLTRVDARAAGVTKEQLRRLVERGILERVAPAVFRFGASPRTWHQDVLTAVLDGGPECLASHRTAAALHGLDGFRPGVIEVLVPMRVRHIRKNVVVHHTRSLNGRDRARVGVIPVTSCARTLIDLGATASAAVVEEAFDGAERDKLVGRRAVESRYQELRARGRNGVGAMTQVLNRRLAVENVPRSVLERRMLTLLGDAGLPMPEVGYRFRVAGGRVYELDFAYVEFRLGIEVDGHGSHATRTQRAADNSRGNALGDEHWKLRRFTYEQVVRKPAWVVRSIRSALAAAASPVSTSDEELRRGTPRS